MGNNNCCLKNSDESNIDDSYDEDEDYLRLTKLNYDNRLNKSKGKPLNDNMHLGSNVRKYNNFSSSQGQLRNLRASGMLPPLSMPNKP
jgi:hypothetical protein